MSVFYFLLEFLRKLSRTLKVPRSDYSYYEELGIKLSEQGYSQYAWAKSPWNCGRDPIYNPSVFEGEKK